MSMKPRWQRTDSKENIIKNENENFIIHCFIGLVLFAIISCLFVPHINGWGFLIGSLGFGLPFGICYLRRPKIGDEYSGYYSYESTDDDSDSSLIGTLLGIVLIGGFIGVFCFFSRLFQFIEKDKEFHFFEEKEEEFVGEMSQKPGGDNFTIGQYVVTKSTGNIFKIHSTIKRDNELLYYSIDDDKYFTAAEIEDFFEYKKKRQSN